jgi:hypothetical protein
MNNAYKRPAPYETRRNHPKTPRRAGRAAPNENCTNIARAKKILEVFRIILEVATLDINVSNTMDTHKKK